jgi:hypothetical protein
VYPDAASEAVEEAWQEELEERRLARQAEDKRLAHEAENRRLAAEVEVKRLEVEIKVAEVEIKVAEQQTEQMRIQSNAGASVWFVFLPVLCSCPVPFSLSFFSPSHSLLVALPTLFRKAVATRMCLDSRGRFSYWRAFRFVVGFPCSPLTVARSASTSARGSLRASSGVACDGLHLPNRAGDNCLGNASKPNARPSSHDVTRLSRAPMRELGNSRPKGVPKQAGAVGSADGPSQLRQRRKHASLSVQ